MYWTLELASYLSDAPWPATKDELIDFSIRTGAPLEVVENLQSMEDEDDVPYMLRAHTIGEDIKLDDLRSFGWNGKVDHNAKIIEFKRQ